VEPGGRFVLFVVDSISRVTMNHFGLSYVFAVRMA